MPPVKAPPMYIHTGHGYVCLLRLSERVINLSQKVDQASIAQVDFGGSPLPLHFPFRLSFFFHLLNSSLESLTLQIIILIYYYYHYYYGGLDCGLIDRFS